jgi:hypothetical protein
MEHIEIDSFRQRAQMAPPSALEASNPGGRQEGRRSERQKLVLNSYPMACRPRLRREGLTLIEAIVYLALTITLTVPLIVVTQGIFRSSSEGSTLVRVMERNRSAFNRLVDEFRYSISGTAVISGGGKVLQFTKQKGYDGAGPIPGSTISYEIRLGAKETLNGKDDDADGLIDEGSLVRVDKTLNKETVLMETLDCAGSSFAANGTKISIILTSAGAVKGKNSTGSVQLSATVIPMNKLP